jgi:hypothetical protein
MKGTTHQSIVNELNDQHLNTVISYEQDLQLLRDRIAEQNNRIAALEEENYKLKVQLADVAHCYLDTPLCVECAGELTESDILAGEDVCLDCAAALALSSDIEHEPGSLLATVRVRLEECQHGTRDEEELWIP